MALYLSIAVPEIEGFPTVLTSFAAVVLPSSEEITRLWNNMEIIWCCRGVRSSEQKIQHYKREYYNDDSGFHVSFLKK